MCAILEDIGTLSEDVDTYAYVDVSNIRASCLKTLNFKIDFEKFYKYLAGKYRKLRSVYYYEGIAADDAEKTEKFSDLAKVGYTIKALRGMKRFAIMNIQTIMDKIS